MINYYNSTFKSSSSFIILISACSVLFGCGSTPVKSPTNSDITFLHSNTLNIDTLTPERITVAGNKSWQSSGVFLENGENITVTANGSWSPAPILLQWSGGEGNAFFGAEIPYIKGGALMAKLGHDGIPFGIGINTTFQSNDYGMLYFAMNDPFDWQYDNQGELNVSIYTMNKSSSNSKKVHKPTEIIAYDYNDRTGVGSLSAKVTSDHFQTRNWMIKKIGEIASSKRVALQAGKASLQGGNYAVLDEQSQNGILTIHFETLW
ncbi:MAG: hypothetical protein COA54_12890 [Thiotrichaceae bacterium]|nr:MAG: hypothetical protein COA54_12890 [Thiotrichaceae bacterium]